MTFLHVQLCFSFDSIEGASTDSGWSIYPISLYRFLRRELESTYSGVICQYYALYPQKQASTSVGSTLLFLKCNLEDKLFLPSLFFCD